MSFVADDIGAWLIGLLADAARRRLATWILGTEQERALRDAAAAAVWAVAREFRPDGGAGTEGLARVISQVFSTPMSDETLTMQTTVLEALQAGISGQLAVLDDATMTGTGQSSAQLLGIPATVLAEKLTGHLVREIVIRGSRGGPLGPLADQLNHDITHLQGLRLEEMVGLLAEEIRKVVALQAAGAPALVSSLGVRYSLPPEVEMFTDREGELDRIIAAAEQAGAGEVVMIRAIGGIPGVGKTALAVHAAHLLRERCPDRQLYVNLHAHSAGQEPLTPEAALAGLLTAIGIDPQYLPGDLEGRAALWRDRMAGQRAVLVLDNAASSAQVAPLLPGGTSCLVLVTTRRHLGDLPGIGAGIVLEVLPPDQAQEMFVRLAPRATADPSEAVAELVATAGFLPLAISLLARVYARHPSWLLADLIAETRGSLLTLAAETDSIGAAFDVSYRYLTAAQQQFFRRIGQHLGSTIDSYAAAALADISLREASEQLDKLHQEGLLTEVSYRRYGMHDLIGRYARQLAGQDLTAERDQALERLLDYYQQAAATAQARLARHSRTELPSAARNPRHLAVPDLNDSMQALSWARTERANVLACLDYVTRVGDHARIIALTVAVAAVLRQDGPWPDAIARHNTAVHAARYLHDRPGEATALTNLGLVQRRSGDYPAAASSLESALGIFREIGDRPGEADALTNLGIVRRRIGDYPGAANAHEEALGIYKVLDDRQSQAKVLTSLGIVRQRTGDYPAATKALKSALSIFREIGDRPGEGDALTNLGIVRRRTGDYPGAIDAQEEALDIYTALGDRQSQAKVLTTLAIVRQRTGDYPGATDALETALGISRDLRYQQGLANALCNLGIVRRESGDYPGAANALKVALGIYLELGDQGGRAETLNEIGTLHRLEGNLPKAEEYHRQALDIARDIGSSLDEAYALVGLGRTALADDRIIKAATDLRQANKILQRINAAESFEVAAELDALSEANRPVR
jgi:tetratricopeptide (TPR) repeat protein